jgi:hypothetical protein
MRDKTRKRPMFNDKPVVAIVNRECRHPECDKKAGYRLIYVLGSFSYSMFHCKDHRDWAEGLADKFEEVIDTGYCRRR